MRTLMGYTGICSVLLVLFFFINSFTAYSQIQKLSYDIFKGESRIGLAMVSIEKCDTAIQINWNSEVKTSMIFPINFITKESVLFIEGYVYESSYLTKLNGREKMNLKMRKSSNGYSIIKKNEVETLSCPPIKFSILNLYETEPVAVKEIYSNNYGKMLPVTRLEEGLYKVDLPGNSYNLYHYKNGNCVLIEAVRSLYTVRMELKS